MWNKYLEVNKGEPVMTRVQRTVGCIIAILILTAVTGLIGCSNGKGNSTQPPSTPEINADVTPVTSPLGDSSSLGYFQFVFDDDGTVRVEDTDPIRGAEANVTPFVSLIIEDFWWDGETRTWHIVLGIKNISVFTGYGVWLVLHSLGPKMVLNQDGFTWALPPFFPDPTRCAFIAYGKENENRAYPPGYTDTREIVLFQPFGIPKLAPIGFWIDAQGVPRSTPGVEDLHVEEIDETSYHLTGYIWDHQSPSEDLVVWADTTQFNGNTNEPLFDDGNHGDGQAGDNIFGCNIEGDPDDGLYLVTVYAFDPEQNQGENDIWFHHGEYVPCDKPLEPVPFEVISQGEHSGIQYPLEIMVTGPDAWWDLWNEHASIWEPPPPAPPVNFQLHNVIGVWVGDRPSNNHFVHITDINFDPCEFIVTVLYEYTPYEACGPLDVITNPYQMVVLPKFEWPVIFNGIEVDCPGPQPECIEDIWFDMLIKGPHSGIEGPYEKRITNMWQYTELWEMHVSNIYPPPPQPIVNFEQHDLIAVGLGNRPTGGFDCTIYEVCWLADPSGGNSNEAVGVFYKEMIPGADCDVPMIITQPYHWVIVPKTEPDVPTLFFKSEEVYHCGDCDPAPFMPIAEGEISCAEPGEYGFQEEEPYWQFWLNVNCWEEDPGGPPPPPLPMDPPLINPENAMYHFGIQLSHRPTSGYFITVEEVCLEGSTIRIKWTEHIPGKNCDVIPESTKPWIIAAVELPPIEPVFQWEFQKSEVVYDCPGDCEPVNHWTKAHGDVSCEPPKAVPIPNHYAFWDVWQGIHCNNPNMPPPPPVNWEEEIPFLIQTPGFPTGGFFVTVDEVCVDFQAGLVKVDWTLHIPGPDCVVTQMPTQPWIIESVPHFPGILEYDWIFIPHEEMYDCPPCVEVPWYQLADNEVGCAEPGEYGFKGFSPQFEELWYALNCWDPDSGDPPPELPEIPDPTEPGWETKPFAIQLDERLSTGFYLTIDYVCLDSCTGIVYYTENIPGPNCPTGDMITTPWVFGVAEFPPIDCEIIWEFVKSEEIYYCDDCQPLDFWQTAYGSHSCAEPGEYGWQYLEPYQQFWYNVKCWDPSSGDPPPPLPGDPEPGQHMLINHLGIQLGERPSTGYYITIDSVCIEGCDVYVEYTEYTPGESCDVYQVVTKPWAIAAVEMPAVYCWWQWHFTKYEAMYMCNEQDCWDFDEIGGGPMGPEEDGTWFFDNHNDFNEYWYLHHTGKPQPEVKWDDGWGAYAIHLGERPTSGFEVEVIEICPSVEPFGAVVRWREWIPGETCDVNQVLTYPWTLVTFPLVDLPYFDEGSEHVYQCD